MTQGTVGLTPGSPGLDLPAAHFEHARRVADAILYEGYLLYPYHQAAQKNRARFQFGVLMPPGYANVDATEASTCQAECLLECGDDADVIVQVRFLQLVTRRVQAAEPVPPRKTSVRDVPSLTVDGIEYTSFDEAAERQQQITVVVSDLLRGDIGMQLRVEPAELVEGLADSRGLAAGRIIRESGALAGTVRLHAERVAGPYQALKLRVLVENTTVPPAAPRGREEGLRSAFIAAHCLIAVPGGRFLSMTDPPEWAAAEVAACQNTGTWPVLAGPAECTSLMFCAPVILYDHPEVAAESAGDLFDATEIDEILTLRTMALTDAEKRQVRATDSRAAELIDRLDGMPPEMLERLHGAIRYLRAASAGAAAVTPEAGTQDITARPEVPWWDPGADASVSPETDQVLIDGVAVARNSRVLMRPGSRRADAQDLFLTGREAVVEAVLHDIDGQVHLAVTPVDDPAADLQRSHGRFLYFAPDEVQPLPAGSTDEREGGERC